MYAEKESELWVKIINLADDMKTCKLIAGMIAPYGMNCIHHLAVPEDIDSLNSMVIRLRESSEEGMHEEEARWYSFILEALSDRMKLLSWTVDLLPIPCPFCGEECIESCGGQHLQTPTELFKAKDAPRDADGILFYQFCTGCATQGPSGDTEKESLEMWNRAKAKQ